MKKIRQYIIILFAILFLECTQNNNKLEYALTLAGKNRIELEKALKRYSINQADSLKYKAACFLIENMPGYYFYDGDDISKYSIYFDILGKSNSHPKQILDSLNKELGYFNVNNLILKYDINEIDSAYLCENIDLSFKVWEESPWCKNVSFNDFCEYILPYRIREERLTNWKKEYYNTYKQHLNALTTDDPVTAAKYLRNVIIEEKGKPRFTTFRPTGYPSLDASVAKHFNGSCDDLTQFTLFAFRAMGIPCSIDFLPICGNYNTGHSWVVFKDKNNNHFAMDFFDNIEFISDKSPTRVSRKYKVFRKTFSYNNEAIQKMRKVEKFTPEIFSEENYRFKDVTILYSNYFMEHVEIPSEILYHQIPNNKIIYLCAPSWLQWKPIDWTIPDKSGKIVFYNQNIGNITRLAIFDDKQLIFITDPFEIDEQNRNIQTFGITNNTSSRTLFSKYSLELDMPHRERMVGGVFEGSNNSIFDNADTLFTIKDTPYRLITHGKVLSNRKYRYIRYKGAAGSYGDASEIKFFSNSTYLTGKIISNVNNSDNKASKECRNIFDKTTDTYFHNDVPDNTWIGLDLGIPFKITEIAFSPRNRNNYIKKGEEYELFVSVPTGWKSLGRQLAVADSLHYDKLPTEGLYYLKNHSSGREERIFYFENEKQVFK